MKILQDNNRIFVLLGICPSVETKRRWINIFHILFSVFCLICCLSTLISSLVYFISYLSTDFAEAICTVHQIIGSVTCLYTLVIAHVKCHDLKKLFDNLQAIYNASKLCFFIII